MYRLFIAAKYLARRRILWISVVGVMLGVGAIVVVDSIFNGFIHEYVRILRGTQADITVHPRVDLPYASLRRQILETEGVRGASRRLQAFCLFPTDRTLPTFLGLGQLARGPVIEVKGIDFAEERDVTLLPAFLTHPAIPEARRVEDPDEPFQTRAGEPLPVLFGDRLADALELVRGDRVELLTFPRLELDAELQPIARTFRVAGTFKTEEYHTDLRTAFMDLRHLQEFAGLPDTAHEIAVRTTGAESEEVVADRLARRLLAYDVKLYEVLTWRERWQHIMGAIENQRSILDFILFFIVLVAGFNLLVTLNMTINQKMRDIGILSSLGGSAPGIATIFTGCGLLVALLGSSLGFAMGFLLSSNADAVHGFLAKLTGARIWKEEVYGFAEIPSLLDTGRVCMIVAGTVVSTLLFATGASLRAARLDPVRALRRR